MLSTENVAPPKAVKDPFVQEELKIFSAIVIGSARRAGRARQERHQQVPRLQKIVILRVIDRLT
jgi:hypothetical protein